jgi:maltose-binding protein MalE
MRRRNFAKSVSFVLALVLAAGFTLALAGCDKGEEETGDVNEFSYWMAVSESSEYYLDYNENPVMKYITQNKTFKDQEGNDAKVSFAIQHPPVGKEVDNLNTLISTGSYTDIVDTTYGTGDDLADMYKEGLVLDLTEYVENNMPNYKAFVDAHPEIDFTKNVDGEEKYLDIRSVNDIFDANSLFAGFSYRRDWIV